MQLVKFTCFKLQRSRVKTMFDGEFHELLQGRTANRCGATGAQIRQVCAASMGEGDGSQAGQAAFACLGLQYGLDPGSHRWGSNSSHGLLQLLKGP